MIKGIRDMSYQLTYFENGCKPITAIDGKLDRELMNLYTEFAKRNMTFYGKVELLYTYLSTRLYKAMSMQYIHFCELYPEYRGQPTEQFIKDTLSSLWNEICPTLCTYELVNPEVVNLMLNIFFSAKFEQIQTAQYSVTIEAFGNCNLRFFF